MVRSSSGVFHRLELEMKSLNQARNRRRRNDTGVVRFVAVHLAFVKALGYLGVLVFHRWG